MRSFLTVRAALCAIKGWWWW